MKYIYTLTLSPAIDKSSVVDLVMAENKLRCTEPRYEPGGGGINVSRAIKKLGGESVAVYAKGGPTGDMLKELLDKEKIDQRTIECEKFTRENFIVVETASNRQYRFGMPGSLMSAKECDACLDILKDPANKIDYMVVSGSTPPGVPPGFYASLSRIMKDKGAKLVLDTSGDALKQAMNEGIYLLKPNLKELSELVGNELRNITEQEDAAMKIIKQGRIEILAVSLGASGAMIASKEGVINVAAPSVAKKSTVGAGDSMVAGMVLSLSRGHSLEDTIKYGVASGTAATMNSGTELCKLEDVETLYKWIDENSKKVK